MSCREYRSCGMIGAQSSGSGLHAGALTLRSFLRSTRHKSDPNPPPKRRRALLLRVPACLAPLSHPSDGRAGCTQEIDTRVRLSTALGRHVRSDTVSTLVHDGCLFCVEVARMSTESTPVAHTADFWPSQASGAQQQKAVGACRKSIFCHWRPNLLPSYTFYGSFWACTTRAIALTKPSLTNERNMGARSGRDRQ